MIGLEKVQGQATSVWMRNQHLECEQSLGRSALRIVSRKFTDGDKAALEEMQQLWSRGRSLGRDPLANALRSDFHDRIRDAADWRQCCWTPSDLKFGGHDDWDLKLIGWWAALRLQPNRTARDLAAETRFTLNQINVLPAARAPFPWKFDRAWLAWSPAPNAAGRLFVASAAERHREALDEEDKAEARHALVAVVIAMARYRLDHPTTPPPDLATLVPGYLPSVPRDPFDGKPIRYDAGKDWLWSVGQDRIDAGGKPYRNREDAEPPVPGTDALWPDDRYTECDDEPTVDLMAFFGGRGK